MLFIDESTKKDKKCPKCGKSKCTCKQGTDECNESDIGIEHESYRLEQYQEEFELFKAMCYADIKEMNMIREEASEEELAAFRESVRKDILVMQESLLDKIKNKLHRAKIKFTSKYPIPKKAVDIDLSESKEYNTGMPSPAKYLAKLKFVTKSLNAALAKGPSFCSSPDTAYYNRKISGTDEQYANDIVFDYENHILPAHIVKEYLDLVVTHKVEQEYTKFDKDIDIIFEKLDGKFKEEADPANYDAFIEATNNLLIGISLFYEDFYRCLKLISEYAFKQEKE